MSHLLQHPPPPTPTPPTPTQKKKKKRKECLFQVEGINIGISLKAYAFSHMMHEKLG